jgi:hypothetical protein
MCPGYTTIDPTLAGGARIAFGDVGTRVAFGNDLAASAFHFEVSNCSTD